MQGLVRFYAYYRIK